MCAELSTSYAPVLQEASLAAIAQLPALDPRAPGARRMSPRSIPRAWVTAGLFAGVCDLTAACIHAGFFGATPVRVFHAVASGLIGREAALAGGAPTAVLGVVLHFVIAF